MVFQLSLSSLLLSFSLSPLPVSLLFPSSSLRHFPSPLSYPLFPSISQLPFPSPSFPSPHPLFLLFIVEEASPIEALRHFGSLYRPIRSFQLPPILRYRNPQPRQILWLSLQRLLRCHSLNHRSLSTYYFHSVINNAIDSLMRFRSYCPYSDNVKSTLIPCFMHE